MNIAVVLGAVAVMASVAVFWWAVSSRPSRARANLFAGLGVVVDDEPEDGVARVTKRVGQAVGRVLPAPLVGGLEKKLVQAGHPYGLDVPRLVGVKTLVGAVLAVVGLLLGQPVFAVALGLFGFFVPDVWVGMQRDKRRASMRHDAADMIDQLTICVEAGLGFDAALSHVVTSTKGPLADELARVIQDMQAGIPRDQALRSLADRTEIPEIRQLVLALIQAQKHGVPIAETMRVQSSEMRLKRKQLTEEKAAKLPVKILFPTMLFIMPALFIVLLGPAFINISHGFGG
jgi:tight adherence protein C